MRIVKVTGEYYKQCKNHGTDQELLANEAGRPCVLLINLEYKGKKEKFVVPFRSNISSSTPSSQFFSLPPNKNTKKNRSHGVHYIKLFPVTNRFINKYLIDNDEYWAMIKSIVDENEKEIVTSCQNYLDECAKGNKHFMTPDIDGILSWLHDYD